MIPHLSMPLALAAGCVRLSVIAFRDLLLPTLAADRVWHCRGPLRIARGFAAPREHASIHYGYTICRFQQVPAQYYSLVAGIVPIEACAIANANGSADA
jgi:hypothetical protein